MHSPVIVFDPTVNDKLSRVRGVGRYLQILKENLPKNTIFTDKIERINTDFIFINPFFNFIRPPLLMKKVARKQIAVIHDLIPLKYPEHFPIGIRGNINVWLNKFALKNYDLIVTDSEASKKDIVQMLKIQPEKVKVIYPCLPKIFTNSELKIENLKLNENWKLKIGNSFCLYVGDATWNKNLVNLAKAVKIANVSCVFVGKIFEVLTHKVTGVEDEGIPTARSRGVLIERALAGKNPRQAPSLNHPWQKELREFLKLTNSDKRFIFAGFIDDYKLIKLYEQAKANILVSRDEGFGFSFVEAANFGCPSVLSNISVLKELADDSAIFADPDNPNDIADKIIEIYFGKDLRTELGFKAQQRSKYFSQEGFRSQFAKLLKSTTPVK